MFVLLREDLAVSSNHCRYRACHVSTLSLIKYVSELYKDYNLRSVLEQLPDFPLSLLFYSRTILSQLLFRHLSFFINQTKLLAVKASPSLPTETCARACESKSCFDTLISNTLAHTHIHTHTRSPEKKNEVFIETQANKKKIRKTK